MKNNIFKKLFAFMLVGFLTLGLMPAKISYAIDDEDYYELNNIIWSFDKHIKKAKEAGKAHIKLGTDVAHAGEEIDIDPYLKSLTGYDYSFNNKTVREIGWKVKNIIHFPEGIDTEISYIDFYKRQNSSSAKGAFVIIEEGAKVKFKNCGFSNTVVNKGEAVFEDCEFRTGEIDSSGTASYVGDTIEPNNISGEPENFVPLSLAFKPKKLEDVVLGEDYDGETHLQIKGTNSDEAEVEASILPEDSGFNVSVSDRTLNVTGEAKKLGEYTVNVIVKAPSEDGSSLDTVERSISFNVRDNLFAKLDGNFQCYTMKQRNSKEGKPVVKKLSLDADIIVGASGGGGGGGGGIGGGGGAAPDNTVDLLVKDGNNAEFIPYSDFYDLYDGVRVTYEITPKGSGMKIFHISDGPALIGYPEKLGTYEVRAKVKQGARVAVTNAAKFSIYDPEVTLQKRLEDLPLGTEDWDMEPYEIPNLGEPVIPDTLKNIYGSKEEGVYGIIGDNESYATETLLIPSGVDLTLHNIKIYSSVKVIVEEGAKLTLVSSGSFAPIEVNGGKFSMDEKSCVVDSVTLNDGSTLSDAYIKSYASLLTDGNNNAPHKDVVVNVNGTVKVEGKNTIVGCSGDSKDVGQTAMSIEDGKLKFLADSSLDLQGGGDELADYANKGGTGLVLNNSEVTGDGILKAQGGVGHNGGYGGIGISGNGTINVKELTVIGGNGFGPYEIFDETNGGDAISWDVIVDMDKEKVTAKGGEGTPKGLNIVHFKDDANNQDIIPILDSNADVHEGYVRVSFKDGEHGKLHGYKSFDVKEGVKWEAFNESLPEVISNEGYKFDKFMPELPEGAVDVEASEYEATYTAGEGSQESVYVISDENTPLTDGYSRVVFKKGEHGSLQGDSLFDVKEGVTWSDFKSRVPEVTADDNYIFDGFFPNLPKDEDIVKSEKYIANYSEKGEVKTIERFAGANRLKTAIKVSNEMYEKSDHVVLAVATNFPDAMSGAPLAKKLNAPILLTLQNELPEDVINEIKRLEAKKVFILGGTGAISENVENKLKEVISGKVIRVGGKDRLETSFIIAQKVLYGEENVRAYVANGLTFADALTSGAVAASKNSPIILTTRDDISEDLLGILKSDAITSISVSGGEGAVSSKLYKKLQGLGKDIIRNSGSNRIETAIEIARNENPGAENVYIATAMDFPDALTGSVLAANNKGVVLLSGANELSEATRNYIDEKIIKIKNIGVFGGAGAISESTENLLKELLGL